MDLSWKTWIIFEIIRSWESMASNLSELSWSVFWMQLPKTHTHRSSVLGHIIYGSTRISLLSMCTIFEWCCFFWTSHHLSRYNFHYSPVPHSTASSFSSFLLLPSLHSLHPVVFLPYFLFFFFKRNLFFWPVFASRGQLFFFISLPHNKYFGSLKIHYIESSVISQQKRRYGLYYFL